MGLIVSCLSSLLFRFLLASRVHCARLPSFTLKTHPHPSTIALALASPSLSLRLGVYCTAWQVANNH